MARVLGVVCDNCGMLDVELNYYLNNVTEDSFPRDGWLSLTQWGDESEPGPIGEDLHLCCVDCLTDFVHKLSPHSDEETEHHHE